MSRRSGRRRDEARASAPGRIPPRARTPRAGSDRVEVVIDRAPARPLAAARKIGSPAASFPARSLAAKKTRSSASSRGEVVASARRFANTTTAFCDVCGRNVSRGRLTTAKTRARSTSQRRRPPHARAATLLCGRTIARRPPGRSISMHRSTKSASRSARRPSSPPRSPRTRRRPRTAGSSRRRRRRPLPPLAAGCRRARSARVVAARDRDEPRDPDRAAVHVEAPRLHARLGPRVDEERPRAARGVNHLLARREKERRARSSRRRAAA